MILKHQPIIIEDTDVFKFDKLDRKESIENLSSLLISTNNAFTLSINANWGAGKTTFIKLWKAYLKQQHSINSIYFSAWEDDFSKEPLISILGEINQYISENFHADSDVEKKFEKVKNVGGKILKRGIPAFLKGMTSGVVDLDKGFEEAIGAIAESTAKELIDNYSKDKLITEEFKNTIQDLLLHIDKDKPFVVFIDELDRCRPTYAIELLERIKHIFGIDGLIFVLAIDKTQLGESIKSQYGNIDTDNYLKRFIDMEFSLKNLKTDQFCHYLYVKVYNLPQILQNKQIKKEARPEFDELAMIKYLVKSLNLSLREIEQVFIQLSIIFKTIQPRLFDVHFRIISLFIIMKMKLSREYDLLIKKKLDEQKLIDLLIDKNLNDDSVRDLRTIIKAIILATAKSEIELNQVITEQKQILEKITSDEIKQREQSWLINLLGHEYGNFGDYGLNQAIETVIKKIEFLDNFNFEGLK